MKKIDVKTMERLQGGITDPGPGGYESCRATSWANYLMSGGDPTALTIFDFQCNF